MRIWWELFLQIKVIEIIFFNKIGFNFNLFVNKAKSLFLIKKFFCK